jgi:hypothetical protein
VSAQEKQEQLAPYTHRNWRAFDRGDRPTETNEWPLFSDAWFTGELRDLGPYSVLNPKTKAPKGHARAALVLRGGLCADVHGEENAKDRYKSFYHGAFPPDELAALLSLCTGARLKAGGPSRSFQQGGDPLGAPMGFGGQIDYSLPERSVHLPRNVRDRSDPVKLDEGDYADRLRTIPALDGEAAGVLVTSVRLYQDALWTAEREPHLAWLFLVSAVETAANHWRRKSRNTVERLTDAKPMVVEMLLEAGGQELVKKVAKELADVTGARLKFTEFILAFNPGPPSGQRSGRAMDWSNLRHALRWVYHWRSKALHGGTPFPAPMCEAPWVKRDGKRIKEIWELPIGYVTYTSGATWSREEIPMLLHVFEHITRGCLLNWWKSLVPSAKGT